MALCTTCIYWAREASDDVGEHHPACPFHPSTITGLTNMPGPVSDSLDPEWGTEANADAIRERLAGLYEDVSNIVNNVPPLFILDLLAADLPREINVTLTEKQWRIIRFALERAGQSI